MAQTRYQDLKAQYDLVKKGANDTNAAATSLNAGLLKSLNVEKLTIETNISELANRYGPKHPKMIEKRAELAEIETKINQQIEKSKQALKNDLSVAKAQLDDIEETIATATGQNNTDNSAMIQLRELEREANTSRNILKSFLEKYKRRPIKTHSKNRVCALSPMPASLRTLPHRIKNLFWHLVFSYRQSWLLPLFSSAKNSLTNSEPPKIWNGRLGFRA